MGLTLIEVLVALAVVATVMIAIVRLHLVSLNLSNQSSQVTQASLLASSKLEQALSVGFPEIGTKQGTETIDNIQMHWKVDVIDKTISLKSDKPLEQLRSVKATTSWKQGQKKKQVEYETWVTKRN